MTYDTVSRYGGTMPKVKGVRLDTRYDIAASHVPSITLRRVYMCFGRKILPHSDLHITVLLCLCRYPKLHLSVIIVGLFIFRSALGRHHSSHNNIVLSFLGVGVSLPGDPPSLQQYSVGEIDAP